MNSNRKSYSWQRVNCSYEKGLYMRIERVESLDKRKCKVFTDEDFAFLLYNGELEKYGVCEGAVLEERTERELLDLLSRRAHERALNLLKVQDRTEGEMCRDRAGDDWIFAGISFCGRCQICGELPAGSWKAEKPGGIEALPAAKRHIARDHPGAAGRDRT